MADERPEFLSRLPADLRAKVDQVLERAARRQRQEKVAKEKRQPFDWSNVDVSDFRIRQL